MHLAIFVQPCEDPKDGFLAQIKTGLFDGGRAGVPNLFKYGETKEQAFENLARVLRKRGYSVEMWDFEVMSTSVITGRTRQAPKFQRQARLTA